MGRFWRKFGRGEDDADQQVKPGEPGAKPVTQSHGEPIAASKENGNEPPREEGVSAGGDAETATTGLAPALENEANAGSAVAAPEDAVSGGAATDAAHGGLVSELEQAETADSPIAAHPVDAIDAGVPDAAGSIEVKPDNVAEGATYDAAATAVPSIGPEVDQVPEAATAAQTADTPQFLGAPREATPEPFPDTPIEAPPSIPGPLAPGSLVANRFTIVRALTPEAAADMLGTAIQVSSARYFAVDDRVGYEHCWSCGSVNNDKNQRFCVDCGAPQRRESVLARTDLPSGEPDEITDDGAYFHLVHPRKQFGSTGISLEVGAFSAEGPHHPNEDSYWLAVQGGCYDSHGETFGVAILADGMGGYAPGSGLISKAIVTTVGRGVFGLLNSEPDLDHDEASLRAVVKGAIADANGKVLDEIKVHGEMGATLVVAIIFGQTAYVANIGDSRAYYVSPAGTVAQLTRDQSLVEQQVAMGRLNPDAVYTAIGNNVILHAVGEEAVEEAFDWYSQPLEPGSYLLLCSDGYWKTMQHAVWEPQAGASQASLRALARSMVENALAQNTDDNTTVVLVGID